MAILFTSFVYWLSHGNVYTALVSYPLDSLSNSTTVLPQLYVLIVSFGVDPYRPFILRAPKDWEKYIEIKKTVMLKSGA